MRKMNIAENIAELRKKKGITQEQLALELNISPQAVSKWERDTSMPDAQMLPQIADFFGVSIDYLFYGRDMVYNEIYEKVFEKVAAHTQMSKESYEDALAVFAYAHHGISCGNLKGKLPIRNAPIHISDRNGLSLFSGKGFGAIASRSFFEGVSRDTVALAMKLLPVLSEEACLMVCMAIISMSDISFAEIGDKVGLSESERRAAIDRLISVGLIVEKESKHKSLGYTYEIKEEYHTCLCILIATLEMQRYSLEGISCCMGYGDYPIDLE